MTLPLCTCWLLRPSTATKTGKEHDGTGVVYFALIRNHIRPVAPDGTLGPQYRLVIIDWDIRQIEGDLLEKWLPNEVFIRLQDYAAKCNAVRGSLGAMIEDKNSGSVLLQQAARRGWPAYPIDSKLTAMGKDERAISCSGFFHCGWIKICKEAYEKTMNFKETTANHLINQLSNFRVGDKTGKRQDDLLDAALYGAIVTFENEEGI